MASSGLLLLLIVSSSFLICSFTQDPPSKIKILQSKFKPFLKKHLDTIRFVLVPCLSLIPVAGPGLGAAVTGILLLTKTGLTWSDKSDLATVTEMFDNLKTVLEGYHMEQKWDTWASGAYHKPEVEINVAWDKYLTLMKDVKEAKSDAEADKHRKEFLKFYQAHEPATETLYKLLTAADPTFISNMGKMIAEHAKCHIKVIREYSVLIHSLIFKGNLLNHFYYHLKEVITEEKAEKAARIAFNAGKVMFSVEKQCISNSKTYIEKDVESLIVESKDRSQLAKDIRKFLDEEYQNYNWVVFAFKTKKSKHELLTILNSHVFEGFTKVSKGSVSVAVAWQVKGEHKSTADVAKAIEKCIKPSDLCKDVPKKIIGCTVQVKGNILVKQTVTAVHAFKKEAHQSVTGEDDEDAPSMEPKDSPFYHTGKCERVVHSSGGYFVMIKSDKEILKEPCKGVECGEHGKCEVVKDTFIGVCECHDRYYGEKCEESLDDYKRNLMRRDVDLETLL